MNSSSLLISIFKFLSAFQKSKKKHDHKHKKDKKKKKKKVKKKKDKEKDKSSDFGGPVQLSKVRGIHPCKFIRNFSHSRNVLLIFAFLPSCALFI